MTILSLIEEAQDSGAGFVRCCEEIDLHPRTVKRWKDEEDGIGEDKRKGPKTPPKNKLRQEEKSEALSIMTSPLYRDLSPKQIVPDLADKGIYIASESSFYRILREEKLNAHRGKAKPSTSISVDQLVATEPNQVWSWDITYLKSPVAGMYYYLYLFVDVWSRKIIGFTVELEEDGRHAARLLERLYKEEGITRDVLTIRSDNGAPMKGATLKATMDKLGITASFSRPRVSDDNPYSEALFRTLKYRPDFPKQPFWSLENAISWVTAFVAWYNHEHFHSAIGFVTPADRHVGSDEPILANRRKVYEEARRKNPDRWSGAVRKWESPDVVVLSPTPESRLLRTAQSQAA